MSTIPVWGIGLGRAVTGVTRRRDAKRNSWDERSKTVAVCYSRNKQIIGGLVDIPLPRNPWKGYILWELTGNSGQKTLLPQATIPCCIVAFGHI